MDVRSLRSKTGNATLILLQVDLSGHSAWMASEEIPRNAAMKRAEFAVCLTLRLSYFNFEQIHWLGDGGLFGRVFTGNFEDAEATVAAATQAFEYFERFRTTVSESETLGLRVSATLLDVMLHPDVSHWYSPKLNEFLKYERELSRPGAFTITHALYEHLDTSRSRFQRRYVVNLGNGAVETIHLDSTHLGAEPESDKRFGFWLNENRGKFPGTTYSLQGMAETDVLIGDAVVLNCPLQEKGYSRVSLSPTIRPAAKLEALMQQFAPSWKGGKVSMESGALASPVRLTFPLSDEPELQIEYSVNDWDSNRAFHKCLLDAPRLQRDLVSAAFAFRSSEGRVLPSNLAIHTAVILRDARRDTGRLLLLAHRVHRKGGYFGNVWSASCEENYLPEKQQRDDRTRGPDKSLEQTVSRGLREEFLTHQFGERLVVSLQAVFMELPHLNIGVLAIADLPTTSFEQLRTCWQTPAEDHAEHDALAVIPIEPSMLRRALMSDSPADVSAECFGDEATLHHGWHPSARLRIACCLWLADKGLI